MNSQPAASSTTSTTTTVAAVPWRFRGAANAAFGSISVLEFDRTCELLWLGDSFGHTMSFSPVQPSGASEEVSWTTYSAFRPFTDGPSRHIQFLHDGQDTLVAFASSSRIRVTKRGGASVSAFEVPQAVQRRINFFQTDFKSGNMYLAGETPGVQRIALETPNDITSCTADGITSALRFGDGWLAVGTSGGSLILKDPRTLETMHSSKPFAQRVTAIAGEGHTIWTASTERNTATVVKIFDSRNMAEPLMLVTGISSGTINSLRVYQDPIAQVERALLVTPQGFHMLQVDAPNPVFSSVGIEGGVCTTGAVTRNGLCAVLGNDKGYLVAISNTFGGDTFSNGVKPHMPPQPKSHHDSHAWSTQGTTRGELDSGFDYDVAEGDLCSSWPNSNYMILAAEGKLRQMNLRIATGQAMVNTWNLTRADVYATDPKDKVNLIIPNPYPFNDALGDDPSKVQQLLQDLRKSKRSAIRAKGDTTGLYSKQEEALQVCYGNTTQTAFNWSSYNSSREVIGIDNSLPESWITPLLQSLYLCHAPHYPVRRTLIHHVCKKEFCVTCEVAIIFSNMMTTSASDGAPIAQCGNLLRTMMQLPDFSDLFVPSQDRDHALAKMHRAQKMLLETFDRDLRNTEDVRFGGTADAELENLMVSFFGTEFQSSRAIIPPRFYWEVPASAAKVDEGLQHLLKQLESYNGDQVQIKRLPPIIVLLLNPEHGNLRPPSSLKFSRPPKEEFNYILCCNVLHLADDVDDTGLFVSHHQTGDRENFVLVNDYLVSAPQPEEMLESAIPATTPHSVVVTCYALDTFRIQRMSKDGNDRPPNLFEVLGPLLINDVFAQPLQQRSCNPVTRFVPQISSLDEILPTDLLALDAEYVILAWGNKRPDEPEWIRRQRKPYMTLARVSCILSSRDGDERTIMDDYVHTPEEVLDYVTLYSGIHDGDLDPSQTTKNITALKATQYKLRALVDRGVKFVGHGLPQDFRVCNIAVPSTQVIDTLELFHRPGHRKLSLRFLAYLVLGERVQEDEHDSVEDARTSLRLYRKYEEAMKLGVFETLMDHIISRGQETNWYVPGEGSASAQKQHANKKSSSSASVGASKIDKDDDSDVTSASVLTPQLQAAADDDETEEGEGSSTTAEGEDKADAAAVATTTTTSGGLILDEAPLFGSDGIAAGGHLLRRSNDDGEDASSSPSSSQTGADESGDCDSDDNNDDGDEENGNDQREEGEEEREK